MGYKCIFTSRDFIQQEVFNHRDFPDEMNHQIAIVFWGSYDYHVISDELVFKVKFVSKVCQ